MRNLSLRQRAALRVFAGLFKLLRQKLRHVHHVVHDLIRVREHIPVHALQNKVALFRARQKRVVDVPAAVGFNGAYTVAVKIRLCGLVIKNSLFVRHVLSP